MTVYEVPELVWGGGSYDKHLDTSRKVGTYLPTYLYLPTRHLFLKSLTAATLDTLKVAPMYLPTTYLLGKYIGYTFRGWIDLPQSAYSGACFLSEIGTSKIGVDAN